MCEERLIAGRCAGHTERCASDHAVTLFVRKKLVLVSLTWEENVQKTINKHTSKQTGIEPEPTNYVPSGVAKLYEPECPLVGVLMGANESRVLGVSTFPRDA
ncbi:hypothetical protein CRG98_004377 [Punica granatum]|uniref:Uncharacterized protein n=1 Tax=Punica granatum TaxID=22663 RepID=A0A2I0L507_PUNGR|nr:hypothetical protein CRG98_004377 [Punica granatum]